MFVSRHLADPHFKGVNSKYLIKGCVRYIKR